MVLDLGSGVRSIVVLLHGYYLQPRVEVNGNFSAHLGATNSFSVFLSQMKSQPGPW